MPQNLKRYYGCGTLHFLTCSCYHRQPWLGTRRHDLLLQVQEQVRRRAGRGTAGSVSGESEHVWQRRFYDFNVWSRQKWIEKLRYMHRNPVARGLVTAPEEWPWSSFRSYAYGEEGAVRVNDWGPAVLQKVA